MSIYGDEDFEEEDFDLEDEEFPLDVSDDVETIRKHTLPPLDLEVLEQKFSSLGTTSTLARSLIGDVQRMRQALGDADATFADLGADVEAGIRALFLEFQKSPGAVLMGVLASIENPAEQLRQVQLCQELLQQREERLRNQLSDIPPAQRAIKNHS